MPKVLDNKVKPFVSSHDIDKGDRGLTKIAAELEASKYGIVVVTRSNQDSPWINFEAGALGRSLTDSRVAPLLVGLSDADVKGPLKQFQNSSASDRDAVLALVRSLNRVLDDSLSDGTLDVTFNAHWPELEIAISGAPSEESLPQVRREDKDLLEEVLTTVRSLQRDVARLQGLVKGSNLVEDADHGNEVANLVAWHLDLNKIRWHESGSGVSVVLPEGTPKVGHQLLLPLQKYAEVHDISVTLQRPDGSSITYAPDGTESRTAALL
ncbi:hypothetical protein [Arthrobacter sp. NPDC092385]|uniref:hypothetical protein n=1 Tax=Arthrobacter sp. NPDC092385 TaxID=3363943 RepID=UPI00382AA656